MRPLRAREFQSAELHSAKCSAVKISNKRKRSSRFRQFRCLLHEGMLYTFMNVQFKIAADFLDAGREFKRIA